jgi:hypothetical protein
MRRLLSAAVMMLLMATSIPGASQADNDDLTVIVLIKDGNYKVGDAVEYYVHVFHKGIPADADTPPVIRTGWDGIGSVIRTGTGVYRGNAVIGQIPGSYGYFPIEATATLGKSGPDDRSYDGATGSAEALVQSEESIGFEISASLKNTSDPVIASGTTLTMKVLTTYARSPVTPDNLHIELDIQELGIHSQELPLIRKGTGYYEAQYKVPPSNTSLWLVFRAWASYNGQERYSLPVLTADFFGVCCRLVEKNDTGAVLEFLVSSTDGKAVQGAGIDMTYCFDDNWIAPKNHLYAGPTNANGSIRADIEIPPGAISVYLYGWANTTALSQQNIGGYIQLTLGKSAPLPSRGILEAEDMTDAPRPGAGHVWPMKFQIFNDTVPWANREVECFVVAVREGYMSHTQATTLEVSSLVTDAAGEIRLPVNIPNWTGYRIQIIFKSATGLHPMTNGTGAHESIDGLFYSSNSYFIYRPQIVLPARPGPRLVPGRPLAISVEAGNSSWPLAAVEWLPGEQNATYLDDGYDLQPLNEIYTYLTLKNGRYTGSVTIPENMPMDRNYTVFVYLDDGILPLILSNGSGQVSPPVIPPKEPSVSLTSGEFCIPMVLVLGVLVTAIAVAAIINYGHRGPEE